MRECYDSLIVAINNNNDQRVSRSLKTTTSDKSLDNNDERTKMLNLI